MRSSSKQQLQKMHAILDKQLQVEQQNTNKFSESNERRKPRNNFHHLRYSSNLNLNFDDDQNQNEEQPNERAQLNKNKQKNIQKNKQANLSMKGKQANDKSRQRPSSMFRKSLEKNQNYKKQMAQSKRQKQYGGITSSSEDEYKQNISTQSKNSLRGSRKNQINQLQKKLLDLEKKMENIGISSSQQQNQGPVSFNRNSKEKQVFNNKQQAIEKPILPKSDSKKQLNSLKQKQNKSQNINLFHEKDSKVVINEGTARFCFNKDEQLGALGKGTSYDRMNIFESNLPLSHRQNARSEESSDQQELQVNYQKFAKINRINRDPIKSNKKIQQKKSKAVHQQSEEEDSDYELELEKNKFHNKSITQQIQRLSILNKQANSLAGSKNNASNQGKQKQIDYRKRNTQKKEQVHKSLENKNIKINTIPSVPDRKTTLQQDILQPKYKVSANEKSKSKAKSKRQVNSQKSLSKPKKVLSKKILPLNTNNREQSTQKKRNKTNLDNSFVSDNSAKSKKSSKSIRSVNSINKNNDSDNLFKVQSVQQKKYAKKIDNLEKELQHYKRLSKRYQSQISDYRLLEIQHKKLQTQFKKSEQIRIQQKRIIESFRTRTMMN